MYTTDILNNENVEYFANLHNLLINALKLSYFYTTKRFSHFFKQMTKFNYINLEISVLEKIKNENKINKTLIFRRSVMNRLLFDIV